MDGQDAFVRSIPKFLRRPAEPLPENPKFMTSGTAVAPAPAHLPPPLLALSPATAAHRRPYLPPIAQPEAAATPRLEVVRREIASPEIVILVPHPAAHWPEPVADVASAAAAPRDIFTEARAEIEDLFGSRTRDHHDEEDDVAFQVTLPRSVIRQIRILAAQEGTTHRAIVLKALRLAGLAIPDGADIDRRILAAKRRQQA